MSLIENVENKIGEWLWQKAVKKGIITLSQGVASWMLAHVGIVEHWGVSVHIDPNILTGALLGVSEVLRNYFKVHYPKYLGWL